MTNKGTSNPLIPAVLPTLAKTRITIQGHTPEPRPNLGPNPIKASRANLALSLTKASRPNLGPNPTKASRPNLALSLTKDRLSGQGGHQAASHPWVEIPPIPIAPGLLNDGDHV
jgi:hypothetical protein